jgi:hypothetical protein
MSAMMEYRNFKSTPAPALYSEMTAIPGEGQPLERIPLVFNIKQGSDRSPSRSTFYVLDVPAIAIYAQALESVRKVIEHSMYVAEFPLNAGGEAFLVGVQQRPSLYPHRLLEMATRAVEQLGKREDENVDVWARNLASDLAKATD